MRAPSSILSRSLRVSIAPRSVVARGASAESNCSLEPTLEKTVCAGDKDAAARHNTAVDKCPSSKAT
eukprot:4791961-Pleurochrysis_carterae.AAC.2